MHRNAHHPTHRASGPSAEHFHDLDWHDITSGPAPPLPHKRLRGRHRRHAVSAMVVIEVLIAVLAVAGIVALVLVYRHI